MLSRVVMTGDRAKEKLRLAGITSHLWISIRRLQGEDDVLIVGVSQSQGNQKATCI